MTPFEEMRRRLQKTRRPRALVRQDKKRAEEAEYKRNAAIARKRDQHCRICGKREPLSTHHVKPRSLMRKSPGKHAVENLLTVCWGPKSCHQELTDGILRVYPLTDEGTNAKVLVEKWDDKVGDYVVAMKAA